MVHHIRRFVHGQGCVQIVLKELDSLVPGYQHTILTYSWCRLCKQVRMWASESLLFWFNILVVTGFVWKGSMFEKVLFSGAMAKLAENLLLIQMFSRYLQIPLVALGLLRVKNLVWGSLVSVKSDSQRIDLSRKNGVAHLEVKSMVPCLQWIIMSIKRMYAWGRADTKTYWVSNWLKPFGILWSAVDWAACIASMWCLEFLQ